jgi:hypothetical protein
MKKLIVLILSAIVIFSYLSCSKGAPVPITPPCTPKAVSSDSAALIKFAGDSIPLTLDSTGLYYHIVDSETQPNRLRPLNCKCITYSEAWIILLLILHPIPI